MKIAKRFRAAAAATLLTAAVAAPAAPAAGDEHGGFVLHRDPSKAVPVEVPPAPVAADGFDWDDAAIGAGTGVAAVLLGAAGAHGVRSRHAAPRSSLSAPGT